ncbi:MAG: hypothetical protein O3A46_05610, partial [Candidatus Poribacteria bacterium]|nr:hypothetical protein [Candidatus Poribacteria bacterium]
MPWQFTMAEWNAQFRGDAAYRLTEMEKRNLRFEAAKWEAGELWHRWDYPFRVTGAYQWGPDGKDAVWAMYIKDNWRAFRTWGLSGFNAWSYGNYWVLSDKADTSRKELAVDWDRAQRPGFSPDYIERPYTRMDAAYQPTDWNPTLAADALLRNNMPLLAYIGGEPGRVTAKDHNFAAGETVKKQIVV